MSLRNVRKCKGDIMLRILTTNEMYRCDKVTCGKENISSVTLMKRAGKRLYECIIKECKLNQEVDRVLIVSGIGNNGGDGVVVGSHLLNDGYDVRIVIVGDKTELSSDLAVVIKEIEEKVEIIFIKNFEDLNIFKELCAWSTFIVDGIFGIGLNRSIEGLYYHAINTINQSNKRIFSIDIPSGINGNNGKVMNIAVEADYTGIVQTYKLGNVLNDALDYHGKCFIVDADINTEVIEQNRYYFDDEMVKKLLPKRKHNSHKYDYGNVLILGGSIGMTGAPILSGLAALRCGSGLVTIGIQKKHYDYITKTYPELMIKPYDSLNDVIYKKDVVGFGPGLGRYDSTYYDLLRELIDSGLPLVIDADGLFYLKDLLNEIHDGQNIIMTPHVGELAMLLGIDSKSILEDPMKYVEDLVNKYNFTVVLKGTGTIIANREYSIIGHFGNPGMATAGSGDVLTGIITSLVGQGLSLMNAAILGVYLHGLAGNYARDEVGEYSLIATDIIKYLSNAILSTFV